MRELKAFVAVLVFALLSLHFPAKAQNAQKQAEKYYNDFEFALALQSYKAALEEQEPTLPIVQRIADCYRFINNSKEAEFWYGQVMSFAGYDPINIYYYAESAKRNGNYQKAKELFLEYGRKDANWLNMSKKLAAACDTALTWIARPKAYEVKLVNSLNTSSADFSPVYYKKGLLFTSDRITGTNNAKTYGWTGNGYLQLYYAEKTGPDSWAAPTPLDDAVNTQFHNGPASVLESKGLIFITRTSSIKKRSEKASVDPTSWLYNAAGTKFINRLEIFIAEQKGKKWGKTKPFAYNSEEYSVGHPAVTPDGKILYFVSDMPGGYGETDIYYSELKPDGTWGQPTNAGPKINTSGKESFPNITKDGVLYFSSDGHIGMGGLDIFKAQGTHKNWTGVQNMKFPINSSYDDFGIIFDETGEGGFLSSGRGDGKENTFDNIHSFSKSYIPCVLHGLAVEKLEGSNSLVKKEAPLEKVKLELLAEGSDRPLITYSDKDGKFFFEVKGGMKYTLRGTRKGYLNQSLEVTPNCRFNSDSVKIEMVFNRDTPNKPIVLENIFYDLDKHNIRPDAALELDKLVQTLIDNPRIRIELSSHTDSRESERYNQMLSDLRAQAAVNYMIEKGIDRTRLEAKGYGETKLLNKCGNDVNCSEDEHQVNRRTEFKILSK